MLSEYSSTLDQTGSQIKKEADASLKPYVQKRGCYNLEPLS